MKKVLKSLWFWAGMALVFIMVKIFSPDPVLVELAPAVLGPLEVTIDEDGLTQIKDHYTVSAPLAGRLLRIDWEPGDRVEKDKTILATLVPLYPDLLDQRAVDLAQQRIKIAEAAQQEAQAILESIQADYQLAQITYDRLEKLITKKRISQQEYDDQKHLKQIVHENLKAAESQLQVRRFELDLARAALSHILSHQEGQNLKISFEIRSPINGQVLKVFQESSRVVKAGDPLLELGNPDNLEVAIDVLSQDAVKIQPGQLVYLEHWGGDETLRAKVRLVEPAAFLKVSALGVDEQRVWVLADFLEPLDQHSVLGDQFRVEARIVIWSQDKVLKVPTGALFRADNHWAVFKVVGDRAHKQIVKIGQHQPLETEIIEGLEQGDQVIVYPSDQISDQVKIIKR